MSKEEARELWSLLVWLVGTSLLYLMTPKFYPPRTLSSVDYTFMMLLPLGAAVSARPAVSWRWLFYYAILGALPFVLELDDKLETPYRIRTDGFQPNMMSAVYLPCLRVFVLAVGVTMIAGIAGRTIKSSHTKTC